MEEVATLTGMVAFAGMEETMVVKEEVWELRQDVGL